MGITGKRRSILSLLLVGTWTAMGLISARNIPLYGLVATPFLVSAADDWLQEVDKKARYLTINKNLAVVEDQKRLFYWAIPVLLLVLFLFSRGIKLDLAQKGNEFDPKNFPVDAVDWVQENDPGERMFNYFPWGGYLLYRLWPDQKVFIDGQTDFYGERLTRQYEEVIDMEPGWQDVLKEYKVDWMILPTDSPIVIEIAKDNLWQIVYRDQTAVVVKHE